MYISLTLPLSPRLTIYQPAYNFELPLLLLARFVTYSLSFSVSVTVCDDYKLSERELDFYLLPERYFFEIS